MSHVFRLLSGVLLVSMLLGPTLPAAAAPGDKGQPGLAAADIPPEKFASDELLVRVKPGRDAQLATGIGKHGVKEYSHALNERALARSRGKGDKAHEAALDTLGRWRLVKLKPGQNLETVRSRLKNDPNVEVVSRQVYFELAQTPGASSDPLFPQQWALNNIGQNGGAFDADIDAYEAWFESSATDPVIVAVVDSGVHYPHEDLANSMWVNVAELNGQDLVDDDGNGCVDDVHGCDFTSPWNMAEFGGVRGVDDDGNGCVDDFGWLAGGPCAAHIGAPPPQFQPQGIGGRINRQVFSDGRPKFFYPDAMGHGTLVAGVIDATQGNGLGSAGVASNARVMAVRVVHPDVLKGRILMSEAAVAIHYAIDNGARVVNASFGGPASIMSVDDVAFLRDAVDYARAHGVLFVASAGNNATDLDGGTQFFPAGFDLDNIISVAATDNRDRLANFSNFGATSVDIAAPGVGIIGPVPAWAQTAGHINFNETGYRTMDGTSFAAPHVAAAAALFLGKNPSATYLEVKNAILSSGDVLPTLIGKTVTGRRLNINNMLGAKFPGNRALSMGTVQSDAGVTVQLPIAFINDRVPPVVGLQFDLTYNPGSLTLGTPVAGNAIGGGHGLVGFAVGAGVLRVVATPDLANTALGSGNIATLPVTILPSAATGSGQEWLSVSNVVMSDKGAQFTPPGAISDGLIAVNTTSGGPNGLDFDRDGMADSWELRFHLNPLFAGDAALDPDGDGHTNLEEFLAGTDPLVSDVIQSPSLEHAYAWTHTVGGTGTDYLTWSDRATAAVSDDGGDIFIAGTFDAPIDFDGNGSTTDNVAPLSVDSFVTKLDRNHQPIWTRVIHGTGGDLVNAIAVDNNGDVYVTGSVTSSVDIDGDGVVDLQNTDGKSWAYVARINADGSVAWGRTFRVESGGVGARSMVVKNGVVALGGDLSGRVDFNPSGTSDIKEFRGGNFSQSAAFVTTLDAVNGAYRKTVLVKPEVNGSVALSGGITVDATGSLYLAGNLSGSADFNPADVDPATGLPLVDMKVAQGTDLFVTKFGPTGDYAWTTTFGASQMQSNPNAAPVVDAQGNVYVTGNATDMGAFGSGPVDDVVVMRGTKKSGIFFTKLDTAGAHLFTRTLASDGDSFDSGRSLSIDTLGNLYLVAEFAGTSKFFPDEKTNIAIAPGSGDVAVVRFTADGNFDRSWTITAGTNTAQGIFGPSVAGYVDLKDNFYLVGAFNSTVDFNPALATDAKTPKGSYDLFISKYLATGSLAPSNIAPMAGNGQVTAAAGATIASVFVASDIDGNSLTFTLASVGTLGTATLNDAKTGAFTFVAKPGVSGIDKLTFTVNDGSMNSTVGTVVVRVGDATADPIATTIAISPVTANLVQGQTLSFVATVNDQYGNPMATAPIVWSATGGAISAGGVYGATVAGGPHTITASSGDLSANATVTVRANVAPTGSVAPITLALGQSFTGQVLAVDGDGDPVQFSLIVDAAIGHAVVNAATGSFTYTSNGTQSGADSFVIGVSDGFAPATLVTVVVHVTSATDTDGDGMADAWEIANFGNLTHDIANDSDLDGFTDLQEFVANTNPLIANDGKTIPDHGYDWTRTAGGNQFEYASRAAVDAVGNVYLSGYFVGSVDFNPSTGVDTRSSAEGFYNAFVTKLNADGSYAWTWTPVQQNSSSWAGGFDVAVDGTGNVYVTGSVNGAVAFDAQNASHFTVSGGAPTEGKIWLASLAASDGRIANLQIIGNATSGGRGTGVEVDSTGAVYLSGYFGGSATFDPAGVEGALSAGQAVTDRFAVFVTRFNANGSYAWTRFAKSTSGTSGGYAYGIAADADSVVLTGQFFGTFDFDGVVANGDDLTSVRQSGYDGFVAEWNASGQFIRNRQIHGTASTSNIWPRDVAYDTNGDVYVTGTFKEQADFNPTATTGDKQAPQQTTHEYHGFLTKWKADGSYGWTNTFGNVLVDGSSYSSQGTAVVVKNSRVYVGGAYSGTSDFDSSASIDTRSSRDAYSPMVASYNTTGAYIGSWTPVGAFGDFFASNPINNGGFIYGLAATNDRIYSTGYYVGALNFNPTGIADVRTSTALAMGGASDDVFVTALSFASPPQVTSVALSPASVSLPINATQTFSASAIDQFGNSIAATYTWTVSGTGATIDANGVFSATAAGIYTVTATSNGVSASATVTVVAPAVLTTITVTPPSTSIQNGQTQTFSASAKDQFGAAITTSITWSVSGGGTISSAGVFTASTVGGPFTVTAASGSVSGNASVTVVSASDLALNKPVQVSSTEIAAFSGANAVDGSSTTRWSSAFADPQWIYVDLQSTYNVSRVVLRWEAAFAQSYRIETSNDAQNWTSVFATTTNTGGVNDVALSNATGRYVRVFCVKRGTAWGDSLWDINIFGTAAAVVAAPVLTTIALMPTTASIQTTQTQLFTASGSDQNGNAMAATYTWSVNSANAAITSGGVFSATIAGTYTVTATSGGTSATAQVTVSNPPPVLTTVITTPTSASIQNGQTQTFNANAKDQFGAVIAAPMTWSVSGGGTIDSNGVFTASTVGGPFTVTATSGSVSGVASVTVLSATVPVIQTLKVSTDGHHLLKADGTPFYWLADYTVQLHKQPATATSTLKLTFDDIRYYLHDRASKGFTVIEGPVLTMGPDINGNAWSTTNDTNNPNEAYFALIDQVIDAAEQEGLYVAPFAMWGSDFRTLFNSDGNEAVVSQPELDKARAYGVWLGNRYKNRKNILWLVSHGYHGAKSATVAWTVYKPLMESLAQGIESVVGNTQLMSAHPGAGSTLFANRGTSAEDFANSSWLDFHVVQASGYYESLAVNQNVYRANFELAEHAYKLASPKPIVEGESGFEQRRAKSVLSFTYFDTPVWDAYAMRSHAYWNAFAGGVGFSYADLFTFNMDLTGTTAYDAAERVGGVAVKGTWKQGLDAPGASQLRFLRGLLNSRPFSVRIADQTVLSQTQPNTPARMQALRASDGSYLMVYSPSGATISVNMAKLAGTANGWWFNPRSGESQAISGSLVNTGTQSFTPPSNLSQEDWVLVLDQASKGFAAPGSLPPAPVAPVLTTIALTPTTASVQTTQTQLFTASGSDQNGNAMAATYTWSVNNANAAITSGGVFSATTAGTYTVTATSGGKSATAQVVVSNPPPVLTTVITAPTSATVSVGQTQQFAASGIDQQGKAFNATYSWTVTGGGTISSNGVFTATTAGGPFTVTATSGGISGVASVTVVNPIPVVTTITMTPSGATLPMGETQSFMATAKDQFGAAITAPITWSVSGGGTIDSNGVFTASTVGGPFTVTATSGSVSGNASVTVLSATVPVIQTLKVSADGHHLLKADGTPFYWLADYTVQLHKQPATATSTLKLTFDDIRYYLHDRASKGFTVIEGPVLTMGPDINGNAWSTTNDTNNPNEAYFALIDQIIDAAEQEGLYVAPFVMWGSDFRTLFNSDGNEAVVSQPELDKARAYGAWLGNRYKNRKNILWLVSHGYHDAKSATVAWTVYKPLMESLAQGIESVVGNTQLMSAHPAAGSVLFPNRGTSAEDFANSSWLDFHVVQASGYYESLAVNQNVYRANFELAEHAYKLASPKPIVEGESGFEQRRAKSVLSFTYFDTPVWDAYAMRSHAYWNAFAGGVGFSYADLFTFNMDLTGTTAYDAAERVGGVAVKGTWKQGLDAPGASQLRFLRGLLNSRPFSVRIADQTVLSQTQPNTPARMQALRASDGSYLMVYSPNGATISVNMSKLAGNANGWWYNPRTAQVQALSGSFVNTGTLSFTPPSNLSQEDWVLVLDQSSQNYPAPSGVLAADTDSDLLPDAWEQQWFGNLSRDGNGDMDGDGVTDREEFLRGTAPR